MILNIIVCVLYLMFAVAGVTFIKSGHSAETFFKFPFGGLPLSGRTIIGILFYGISFLLFVFYVSKLKIGIAIPVISGLNCVAVVAIGYLVFKERITIGQFVGITLIVLGTVLVGVFKYQS